MMTVTMNGRAPAAAPAAAQPWQDGRWWRRAARAAAAHRGWLAAIPVVLVNVVATGAQLAFWRARLPSVTQAVLVALALESIAIYLAWQAHLAQLADDSALRLRLAAYGFAAGIGVLNYSHYMAAGWRPTVAAVTFGMMSAVSPWLWSVHSRRVSRDALKERGLIEAHSVRLGGARWWLHAYRSVRVMRRATWDGENDPARAIALVYPPGGGDAAAGGGGPRPPAVRRKPPGGQAARAAAVLGRNPGASIAEVMRQAGVGEGTARRARNAAAAGGGQ